MKQPQHGGAELQFNLTAARYTCRHTNTSLAGLGGATHKTHFISARLERERWRREWRDTFVYKYYKYIYIWSSHLWLPIQPLNRISFCSKLHFNTSFAEVATLLLIISNPHLTWAADTRRRGEYQGFTGIKRVVGPWQVRWTLSFIRGICEETKKIWKHSSCFHSANQMVSRTCIPGDSTHKISSPTSVANSRSKDTSLLQRKRSWPAYAGIKVF